ncbi:hypothetical protein V2J09_000257 [Rumex salicifolius]
MGTHQNLQETNGDPKGQQKARNYGMSLSKEVNMTNCYNHCKHFFERCKSIHFNVLIAYWMMAGYLGPIDSIEAAYKRGHKMLLDLTYEKGRRMLKPTENPEMIEIRASTDSEPLTCVCSKHKGLCILENHGFVDLVDLATLEDFVVLADGMLKSVPRMIEDESQSSDGGTTKNQPKGSVLLVDGNHLSRQVFHPPRKLRQLAYFKPRPKSLDLLLTNVSKLLSVLLLRDCELLQEIDLPREKIKKLTVLEISGLSHVPTTKPLLDKISNLSHLQCLHLSDLLIKELPDNFFTNLVQLRWLILRGCSELVCLPSVRGLRHLKMLDLSHSSALEKFTTGVLSNSHLQMLDFSYTSMTYIPTIKESPNLTHLIARDVEVSVLCSLRQVSSLEVLDLSGAQKVKQITQLEGNTNLRVLDLSRTEITSIPFLPNLVHLHDLILRQCDLLTQLPAVKTLTKLEVFDISGCKSLKELPEGLSDLKSLKELNLSLTSVSHLPSFAKLTNLLKLSLRGLEVVSLEGLDSLSNIKELDLSSLQIIPPQELKFDFMQFFVNLQILDLSETPVAQLPDMSKLVNLKELLLANCQHLEVVPNLKPLTNLETLDLSLLESSTINNGQGESENKVPSSRRKLVLKNRSGVQGLFPLTSLGELGHLDLRGTDVERIPYEKMAPLNCIQLPAKIGLSGVCLSKIGALREVIDWKDEKPGHLQGKFSDASEIEIISTTGNKSSMSAGGDNQFFHLCKESWEAFIHLFPVSLPPKGGRDETIYLHGDEFILRNNLSWARRLLNHELLQKADAEISDAENVDAEKFAEIHGFSKVPKDFQDILDAENVAFVGNDFLVSLSDICSKPLKVCCIRRCQKIFSVLSGKETAKCPERLVLSDLVNLKLIYNKIVPPESIESLKHLHIDCCPKLENVIIASPVPKKLEILHVKFCDELKNLFEQTISLNHLQKLIVFELPKLEGIEADFPKLKVLNISQCPKLRNLDGVVKSAVSCLTQVCIDSCNELVTLFDITGSSINLQNLQTLRLHNLPKLESIEAASPKLKTLSIGQCPKLKNLDGVIESASASLTQLCLESCPGLKHALPSLPELEKLEELKISSCNEIVTLFANTVSSSSSSSKKHNLRTLRLRNLPKLKGIGAELSLTSAPDLDPYLPANLSICSTSTILLKQNPKLLHGIRAMAITNDGKKTEDEIEERKKKTPSPYDLFNNDNPGNIITQVQLKGENFEE